MAEETTVHRVSHYRLIARLGKGAMGVVYRAIDERLGRPVALKLLPRARAESADSQARLLREAQAASALNHPGIVTVHDVGAWQGQVFMVMELVDGERLSDAARAGVSVDEALRLVADAAEALGAAHARNILHRDIKSDNLMRTRDGRIKVLDFGLAKLRAPSGAAQEATTAPVPKLSGAAALAETLATPGDPAAVTEPPRATGSEPSALALALASDEASHPSEASPGLSPSSITLAGQLVGTPAYMAPEQTGGGSGDAQSEVFSLGVVLYELLCGQRPFDRPTVLDTLEAVREAPLHPPSALAPERRIPPDVDDLVLRALDRDRGRRFVDMAQLARACREAAPARRREGRERRRGLLLSLLALGLLGAGLAC
jgi:serine/threonine protein kinase